MDSRYSLDAADVLRTMTPGLMYGNHVNVPRGDEVLALTVAGAAACHNSEEELRVFSRRRAAALEEVRLTADYP